MKHLIIACAVLVSGATCAAEVQATLTVPGNALVFAGEGLQAPDQEGHFAFGIRLPVPGVDALHCDTGMLIVGMGTLNRPPSELTAADRAAIARNDAVYARLVAARASGDAIKLPLRNDAAYLKVGSGTITASYCMLSIDEGQAK